MITRTNHKHSNAKDDMFGVWNVVVTNGEISSYSVSSQLVNLRGVCGFIRTVKIANSHVADFKSLA